MTVINPRNERRTKFNSLRIIRHLAGGPPILDNIVDIFEASFPLRVDTSDGVAASSETAWHWEDAMRKAHDLMHGVGHERRTRIGIRHTRFGDVVEMARKDGDWIEVIFDEAAIETLRSWYP